MNVLKFFVSVVWFLILYLVAFFSSWNDKEDDAVLFVNRSQWQALFVMWLPVLAVFL